MDEARLGRRTAGGVGLRSREAMALSFNTPGTYWAKLAEGGGGLEVEICSFEA